MNLIQAATQTDLRQVVSLLQVLATIFSILAVLGPIAISALLWKAAKEFSTKSDIHQLEMSVKKDIDGIGIRLNRAEAERIGVQARVDEAHTRLDRVEGKWEIELKYIRRDMDVIREYIETRARRRRLWRRKDPPLQP